MALVKRISWKSLDRPSFAELSYSETLYDLEYTWFVAERSFARPCISGPRCHESCPPCHDVIDAGTSDKFPRLYVQVRTTITGLSF